MYNIHNMDKNPVSILYVDDEEILLDLAQKFLERLDTFAVKKASSATEALTFLTSSSFDVIVSDYQMPDTDGIEFLKQVRKHYPELPFILFTGRGREEVVIQAINNGATFYIQKGGDPTAQFTELAHKIRQAVSRVRAERELGKHFIALQQQERVIKEGENFYRTVFENTGTAMMVIEEDLTIRLANAECERLCSCHSPDFQGKKQLPVFVAEGDRKRILAWHRAGCRNGKTSPSTREFTFVTLSGEHRRVFATLAFIPGTKTSVASLVDITETIRMKDALKHAETLHRTIFEISPDPIAITDLDGNLVRTSQSARELFGLDSEEDALGTSIFDWIAPEVREPLRDRVLTFIRVSPVPLSASLYPLVRKDGTRFFAEISSSVLRKPDGRPEGMVSILRNVTDRIAAENAMKKAREKLGLLAMMTQCDILDRITLLIREIRLAEQDGEESGKGDRFRMIGELARAVKIQVQFLQECQAAAMNVPSWQDFSSLIRGSLVSIERGEDIIRDTTQNLEIFADPLLSTAIFNILDNALRHGKNISRITIRCERNGPDLDLFIEDDGRGIPHGKKEKIFRRGYSKETGLGLFTSREILAITGIALSESGIYGKGARFVIHIPAGQFRFGEVTAGKGSAEYPKKEGGAAEESSS